MKFFLHISKEEQKKRLIKRIEDKAKNWKFSEADIEERKYWENYQKCYEGVISKTGTKHVPWFIVPSDKKWYSRLVISEIIVHTLKKLGLKYPELAQEQLKMLEVYKKKLLDE